MEAKPQLTDEQIQALGRAVQAAAEAIQEFVNRVAEIFTAAMKSLSELLARIITAYRRKSLYFKLRSLNVPHVLSYWIAKLMPHRLLLM